MNRVFFFPKEKKKVDKKSSHLRCTCLALFNKREEALGQRISRHCYYYSNGRPANSTDFAQSRSGYIVEKKKKKKKKKHHLELACAAGYRSKMKPAMKSRTSLELARALI